MPSRPDLIRLLTAYRPTNADEAGFRRQMLDVAAAAVDPFDRGGYRPGHFTAGAFVLHPGGDRVLLVHHRKLRTWVQPGGHIDPSDAGPEAAAVRELREETGVAEVTAVGAGLIDLDVHRVPEAPGEPEHLHLDLRFAFVASDAALTPADEVLAARWVHPSELAELDADRSVTRPVAKLLPPSLDP